MSERPLITAYDYRQKLKTAHGARTLEQHKAALDGWIKVNYDAAVIFPLCVPYAIFNSSNAESLPEINLWLGKSGWTMITYGSDFYIKPFSMY